MTRIVLSNAAEKTIARLRESSKTEDFEVYQRYESVIEMLKIDLNVGEAIRCKKIRPQLRKLGVSNLARIGLDKSWRVLFSVHGSITGERIIVIHDVMTHREYDAFLKY